MQASIGLRMAKRSGFRPSIARGPAQSRTLCASAAWTPRRPPRRARLQRLRDEDRFVVSSTSPTSPGRSRPDPRGERLRTSPARTSCGTSSRRSRPRQTNRSRHLGLDQQYQARLDAPTSSLVRLSVTESSLIWSRRGRGSRIAQPQRSSRWGDVPIHQALAKSRWTCPRMVRVRGHDPARPATSTVFSNAASSTNVRIDPTTVAEVAGTWSGGAHRPLMPMSRSG